MPRVLIASHYTSETLGGEAAVPLRIFDGLRRRGVEAWLVAHDSNREELTSRYHSTPDRLIMTSSLPGMTPVFTRGEKLADGPRAVAWAVTQIERQLAMAGRIRHLVGELAIGVVHQPIGVAPSMPSPLTRLGVPLVIGPLNGGMVMPPAFRDRDTAATWAVQAARRPLGSVAHHVLRGKLEAAVVLVANERTRQLLPKRARQRSVLMPENAIRAGEWAAKGDEPRTGAPTRFAFLGRLVALKAPDLLLRAFADAACQIDGRLEFIGDGPMRAELEAMARDLHVADRVVFSGWCTKSEASARLRDSDVFACPSLREAGGAVVLEAMASGLACIVADWGGPADYIADGTGLRIDVSSREQFTPKLSAAMVRLAGDPVLRAALGTAARAHVEQHYDWDVLIDQLCQIYDDLGTSRITGKLR